MRFGKIVIGLLTIALAALALLAGTQEVPAEQKQEPPLSVSVHTGQETERLDCWESPQNGFYVFLPGYAELDQVFFSGTEGSVVLDGMPVSADTSFANLCFDTPYPLRYTHHDTIYESILTLVHTSAFPAMYIDTASGSMEYIHMEKGNKETGRIRLYDEDGGLLHDGGLTSIKGRGNTSWASDKKPYNLVLSQAADLLDMGLAERWILLAEGAYSLVNIRNKIVYDFSEAAGLPYSPQSQWVELYLNGDYAGLYLLCERNEVLESRVNIAGDRHFLVSVEDEWRVNYAGYPYVLTAADQALRIHSSDTDDRELTVLWQAVENAILAEDGIDPVTGQHWLDLIDLDSWVRKYLLEEVFANNDGGALSQFFYRSGKNADEKIYAGPVWDYDYAMGGYDTWLKDYTDYYVMNRLEKENGKQTPWFYHLYQKPEFYDRLRELYRSDFLPLLEQLTESGYDQYVESSLASQRANGIRWGISAASIEEELAYIRRFLTDRTAFLSSVWLEGESYHVVRVSRGTGDVYGHLAVRPGALVPALPDSRSSGYLGWFHEDTGEPFDPQEPVTEDIQITMAFTEFQIPKITFVPVGAMLLILGLLAWQDRHRSKENRQKRKEGANVR